MDSDYRQWSMGYDPLYFALSVCPKCNFVGRPDEFESEQGDIKEDHPHQHWEETERLLKEYPISRRFISYAERIEMEGASEKDIGQAYLHASWGERLGSLKDRMKESVKLERKCQQNAVKYLFVALQKGALPPFAENIYLIGELHRRIGNFPEAIEYFDQATKQLEKEKYYILILEDAGPHYDVVEVKVRANSSIDKAEWQRVLKSIPCKMLGDLTFDKAQEWVNLLSDLKASVSIKEQTELPNDRKEVLSLIDKMKAFAIQDDSENKTADEKKKIFI
jgi:tetratricopeptide (TPR) repeat protein